MSRLLARFWAWWFTWVCPPWTEEYAEQAPALAGYRDRSLRGKARKKARQKARQRERILEAANRAAAQEDIWADQTYERREADRRAALPAPDGTPWSRKESEERRWSRRREDGFAKLPRRTPPGPERVWVWVANMDFKKDGDGRYLAHLIQLLGGSVRGVGLLLLQEVGHGLLSTQIRVIGNLIFRRAKTWVVGRVGAHRGVARGRLRLGRGWVVTFSLHGLHRKTSGVIPQGLYYRIIALRTRWLNLLGIHWIIGGDFNADIFELAKLFGGTAHGEGIVGIIVSPGLVVYADALDETALEERWSDHPAYGVLVGIRMNVLRRPNPRRWALWRKWVRR